VGQDIYFWPGFEDSTFSSIIQPVLQWGSSPYNGACADGNGAPAWGLGTYAIGSDGSAIVQPVTCGVNPDDHIQTIMEALQPCTGNGGNCWWLLDIYDSTTGVGNSEYFFANINLTQVFEGTVEGWTVLPDGTVSSGIGDCRAWPNGSSGLVKFFNTQIQANWNSYSTNWQESLINVTDPDCNYGIRDFSGGATLYF
jgi:hypothetical protein